MIAEIRFRGPLVNEHCLPGVRRADRVFPAHPSAVPVSRNRWMILIAPRGLRCQDDDHSIIYQIRRDRPDGELLREGFIAQGSAMWDALGDGTPYVKLLRHPTAFGVPKGAILNGAPAFNANIFAVMWSVGVGGVLDHSTQTYRPVPGLQDRFHQVHWCQCRLNDAEDDIEMLQGPRMLRQQGFEDGPAFCEHGEARSMISSLVPAVPYNDQCTQWVIANNLGRSIAVLRFEFNQRTGLYEWARTGPMAPTVPGFALSEGNLATLNEGYVLAMRARRLNAGPPDWLGGTARDRGDTAWIRLADPMEQAPPPTIMGEPNRQAPLTLHTCADGTLRMFSGDLTHSPHNQRRDPLYCWNVDPQTWRVSDRRVVCDMVAEGIFPADDTPRGACFATVLPHMGGDAQHVLFRGMCYRYRAGVEANHPAITPEQLARHAIYHATIRYEQPVPAAWRLESDNDGQG